MKLVEIKCVKNQEGSFSFFKLTGVNELIYVEGKKESTTKKKKDQEKKAAVNSNANTQLEGQTYADDTLEYTPIEDVIKATGCTTERAEETLSYAERKENPVGFAISAIKGNWNLTKKTTNGINPTNFNNFESRQYNYDDLETRLLGWRDENEISDEEALTDYSSRLHNYP